MAGGQGAGEGGHFQVRHLHVSVEGDHDGGVDGAGHQGVGGGQQPGGQVGEHVLLVAGKSNASNEVKVF